MIEAQRRWKGVEGEPAGVGGVVAGVQFALGPGGEDHGDVVLARVAPRVGIGAELLQVG